MNIDIIPNGAIKRVHVSQNDVGRTLTFELFNNSTSYTIPSGATVKIQGTKPSGFGFSETCSVSGNVVTVDTTEAMTDEFGYIETELVIESSGDVLGTSNFILAVEKNPHPSNTTDGTQITAQSLQVQINELRDIIESGGSGLTDGAKQALLNCLAHVAWIDEDGQDYYDALESALYPPVNLTSISCVYTQSGTVYDTDSLDSLKSDLVVTAHYDDSSTQTVTTYTLSGSLTVGTSTITVAYGGKTTTFNVTVTEYQDYPSDYTWLYKSQDGVLLSARSDLVSNVLKNGNPSETLVDGYLHIATDNTTSGSYEQFNLLPTTATDAVLTAKIKCTSLCEFINTFVGLRLTISNGSSGATFAVNDANIKYAEGSTYQTVQYPDGFDYTDWNIYQVELTSDGKQIGYINGEKIFESSTLCSTYTTANRLAFIASSRHLVECDVEWVAYWDRSEE